MKSSWKITIIGLAEPKIRKFLSDDLYVRAYVIKFSKLILIIDASTDI